MASLTPAKGRRSTKSASLRLLPDAAVAERRRTAPVPGGSAIVAAAAVLIVAIFDLNIPYFAITPGPAEDVLKLIEIDGAKTQAVRGELLLTTVRLEEIKVAQVVRSWFDGSYQVLSRSTIIGPGESEQEADQRTTAQMQESHVNAGAAAFGLLGYEVKKTPVGARVLEFAGDGPAQEVLRLGDVIVETDSSPVRGAEDFSALIKRHKVGDVVVMRVKRGAQTLTLKTKTVGNDQNPSQPVVGVYLDTPFRIELPLALDIKSLGIGGPSAGLMYALGIVDLLDRSDMTQGRRIAGTGEITVDGVVNPVGGIRQKIAGARKAGAELFVVPSVELKEACEAAGDMPVIAVKNLREAVRFLRDPRLAQDRSCA